MRLYQGDVVKRNGEKIIYRNNLGSLILALIMTSRLLLGFLFVVVCFLGGACVHAQARAYVFVLFACV